MRRKKPSIIVNGLAVTGYAAEGKALARHEGKVIFIEGAVPGDVVDVRLNKSKKDWAEGQVLQFVQYAPQRVQPFCQHFGVCGGCQWQMLPYEEQLQHKHQQVVDALTRIGKIELPAFNPILGAAETRFYRNKLEYTFSTREFTPKPPGPLQTSPQGGGLANAQPPPVNETAHEFNSSQSGQRSADGPSLGEGLGMGRAAGFHARGFFDKVVAIEKCWLQPEPTNGLRNFIRDYAFKNDLVFYNIREHHGFLRTMQVRTATTGEVMVNIVVGENDKENVVKLMTAVQQQFPDITTLLYTINTKFNDSLHDLQPQVYSGPGFIVEQLENFRFKIGPKSFFQTASKQAEELYKITREFAALDGTQVLYDLYCGTGSIGIFCSRGAKKIVGVEAIAAAVADAKENAAMNNIGDAHFFAGDVTDVCNDAFFAQHGRPDVIITDPPRAGMHAALVQKILDIAAPVVVYVSCNPATQGRDLALLDAKYAVAKVQPVDMFPHTHHIENVVQLRLRA